jgi:hypothetical protein
MLKSGKKPMKEGKKRLGRPPTGHDPGFTLRLSYAKRGEIREFAEATSVGVSEAVRLLIDRGLASWHRAQRRAPK